MYKKIIDSLIKKLKPNEKQEVVKEQINLEYNEYIIQNLLDQLLNKYNTKDDILIDKLLKESESNESIALYINKLLLDKTKMEAFNILLSNLYSLTVSQLDPINEDAYVLGVHKMLHELNRTQALRILIKAAITIMLSFKEGDDEPGPI
jgi:hypothetical protein